MGWNCTHKHTVRASGSSRPPGKAAYNIEPAELEEEESVEVLDSLPLGAIFPEFAALVLPVDPLPDADWRKYYWNFGQRCH